MDILTSNTPLSNLKNRFIAKEPSKIHATPIKLLKIDNIHNSHLKTPLSISLTLI